MNFLSIVNVPVVLCALPTHIYWWYSTSSGTVKINKNRKYITYLHISVQLSIRHQVYSKVTLKTRAFNQINQMKICLNLDTPVGHLAYIWKNNMKLLYTLLKHTHSLTCAINILNLSYDVDTKSFLIDMYTSNMQPTWFVGCLIYSIVYPTLRYVIKITLSWDRLIF